MEVAIVDNASMLWRSESKDELPPPRLADGRTVEEVAKQLLAHTPWLIDPRRSKFIGYWDAIITLALAFTALVTPFEVALLPVKIDALFVINRVVDAVFLSNIIIQFCTMAEAGSSSSHAGTIWLAEPWPIAKKYMKTWFVVDLVAVLVGFSDFYVVTQPAPPSNAPADDSRSYLAMLKAIRLVRMLRLTRTSAITQRWQTRVSINYAMLAIIRCMIGVLLTSHWMACVWILQAHLAGTSPMLSWMGEKGYCVDDASVSAGYRCDDAPTLYTASLYFSVMTITSIGYGDIAAAANNSWEQAWCVALMLISSLVWAQVIGTYCGIVAQMNPEANAFHEIMDDLNRFMSREHVPREMRSRLREYFHQSKHLRVAVTQRRLLEAMPPSLKGEVTWVTNSTWIQKIQFLKKSPREFMVELATALTAMVYAPGDTLAIGCMYIVHRGFAMYQAKLATKGKVFGEDMILYSAHLRSNAQARAMNYLEVYYVSRRILLEIASHYPRTAAAIRRAAILIALRRELIIIAKFQIGASKNDTIGSTMRRMKDSSNRGATASVGQAATLIVSSRSFAVSQNAQKAVVASGVPGGPVVATSARSGGPMAATSTHLPKLVDEVAQVKAQVIKLSRDLARSEETREAAQAEATAQLTRVEKMMTTMAARLGDLTGGAPTAATPNPTAPAASKNLAGWTGRKPARV